MLIKIMRDQYVVYCLLSSLTSTWLGFSGTKWDSLALLIILLPGGENIAGLSHSAACENPEDFLCPRALNCVPQHKQCDFHYDCIGGEDEEGCGESCDFDTKWPYEKVPCSGWEMPPATDGKPGFRRSCWAETHTIHPAMGQLASFSSMQNESNVNNSQQDPENIQGYKWSRLVNQGIPRRLVDKHIPDAHISTLVDTDKGPFLDHSLATTEGHYAVFLNKEHATDVRAQLVSPWFGATGPQCYLNFSINMYGMNVGNAKLYIKTTNRSHELWNAFGQKGSRWLSFSVPLGAILEPLQLRFEAIQGFGDHGHIAIDSLYLVNCDQDKPVIRACHLAELLCENQICIPVANVCDGQKDCVDGDDENPVECAKKIHPLLKCDFEEHTCGWKNGSWGIPWNRHNGSTPSEDTGPSVDHTMGTSNGFYLYLEASGRSFKDEAVLQTRKFPTPEPMVFDQNSPYYGTCQVRFFYHMFGVHINAISLYLRKYLDCSNCQQHSKIWNKTVYGHNAGVDEWLRVTVPLPPIYYPFDIEFVATKGIRYQSDIAIDDISLTPECFGMGIIGKYSFKEFEEKAKKVEQGFETITEIVNNSLRFSFKTCANTGRHGPTQPQCDAAYMHNDMHVDVLSANRLAGIQVWTVPESTLYSITALGAMGGTGVRNPNPSKGAYAHAKFNLTQGEKIYLLIGQPGESACSQTNKRQSKIGKICSHWNTGDASDLINGGGGGGGGGTFVFKIDPATNETVPLIIAGGGGGKSFQPGSKNGNGNQIKADGGLSAPGPGNSSFTPLNGPGSGGGWFGLQAQASAGMSLTEGGHGGIPCHAAADFGWEISGAFGGGGGACKAGGGGGGYTGGNVSLTDDPSHNGQGGSSYISQEGFDPRYEPSTNDGDGEVEIAFVLDCPCEFMCIYQNYAKKEFKCYCAPNNILADDGFHCLDPEDFKRQQKAKNLSSGALAAIIIGGLVLLLSLCGCVFCIVHHVHKRRLQALRLERLSSPDYQLDRLRSAVAASHGIVNSMEYNPNYDFGGTKCTLQDLREIPRERLSLVRPLGQGAFGEVYQGLLFSVPRESTHLGVAVKTLPALCTDQAEMDFLMEALIMSKFNHLNIVRFIGVCFEKHPRFIVLELLEGGDLKTFLRESRPKPDSPSVVTMIDLVNLALDVSKGCQYLEENHFIHRDIAARNCLLTDKGTKRVAKIADFGMARDIYRADYYRKGGKAMLPVKWMPPEAFLDGVFTSKTDVWSFGILLWEVFSLGYMPYPGRGNQEVMQLVTAGGRLEPPQNCPSPVYHIMTVCWADIPDRRPNFGMIIEKLQSCLQDPEVIYSPLPVFQRPPSVERDATIMRPHDPDRVVLTVEPPFSYLDPDSPVSMDQLIGPTSPDFDQTFGKIANMSGSAESLDGLLKKENENKRSMSGKRDKGAFQFDNVFNYDMFPHAFGETNNLNCEGGAVGCANIPIIEEEKSLQDSPALGIGTPFGSSHHGSSDMNDSGKSSIDNMSQSSGSMASNRSTSRVAQQSANTVTPVMARSQPPCKTNGGESSNVRPCTAKQTHQSQGLPTPLTSHKRSTAQAAPFRGDSHSPAWDTKNKRREGNTKLYEDTGSHGDSLSETINDDPHSVLSGKSAPSNIPDDGSGCEDETKDQGDSGVIIDLKCSGSQASTKDCGNSLKDLGNCL